MNTTSRTNRRQEIAGRIASTAEDHFETCTMLGCSRPTTRAARIGLAGGLCRYHLERRRRFGSAWAAPIKATDLAPYLKTSLAWIKERRASDPIMGHVLLCLRGLLDGAGPVDPVMNLRRRPAEYRAKVAFARLREAEVPPERLLAVHLAVSALMEDDRESPHTPEFRVVQVAKALHRLASGTHRRWIIPLPSGDVPHELHAYPKSTGRVLRLIGEEVDELCRSLTERDLRAVIERKRETFGLHPSHLPGWLPRWRRVGELPGSR